jgi:hypothetical protein
VVGRCKGSGDVSTSGILDIEGANARCLIFLTADNGLLSFVKNVNAFPPVYNIF